MSSERQQLKVSIILPTYNRADLIGETLDSILAQTRPVDEILVMVDGSTDDTLEVLKAYGDQVTVYVNENQGKAATLNLALSLVSGDLVWICDDDDLLVPTACERLVGVLEAEPEAEFVAGHHKVFRIDPATGEKVVSEGMRWHSGKPETIFSNMLDDCFILQPGLVCRKSCYDKVGPFNTDFVRSQDYEMNLRLARHCRGRLIDDVVYHYRQHDGPRGQASVRFTDWSRAKAFWRQTHRMLFEPLVPTLTVQEMLPKANVSSLPADEVVRLTKIRRGCIYARQGMWPEALAELRDALKVADTALSDAEKEQLQLIPTSYFGFDMLLEDAELTRDFGRLSKAGPAGKDLLRTVRRHSRWRFKRAVRDRSLAQAALMARFFWATA